MYCEDVDFCAAVRANGGKVYFAPAAEIVHFRGRSWRANPRPDAEATGAASWRSTGSTTRLGAAS